MTLDDFKKSLVLEEPPEECSPLIEALWYDAQGDWSTAHRIAQSISSEEAAWVHAYLHRKEGDLSNSAYWYHRAKKIMSHDTLPEEWESIVSSLLR